MPIIPDEGMLPLTKAFTSLNLTALPLKAFDKFTHFPRLPNELKLRIIKFSQPQDRIVEVMFPREWSQEYGFSTDVPPALHVCKMWREEALKTYTVIKSRHFQEDEQEIYIDFNEDHLSLRRVDLKGQRGLFSKMFHLQVFAATFPPVHLVKHLIAPIDALLYIDGNPTPNGQPALSYFKNLKTFSTYFNAKVVSVPSRQAGHHQFFQEGSSNTLDLAMAGWERKLDTAIDIMKADVARYAAKIKSAHTSWASVEWSLLEIRYGHYKSAHETGVCTVRSPESCRDLNAEGGHHWYRRMDLLRGKWS